MRLLAGFALVLVGIAFAQSQLVVPQFNNLNAVLSLVPQIQGFISQLDSVLRPQLAGILSSSEFQSFKDKVTQIVLSTIGSQGGINAIKDKLRPFIQQVLASKPQARVSIEQILGQVAQVAISLLPSLIGLIGKREIPVADARLGLSDIVALADKLQLSTILPQIQQLVSGETLQQLQSQFLNTMITAVGSHWNLNTIAQQLQQLFTQFVPGVAQMRIDWEQIGQQALNGVVSALPSILIGALSLFGKRDLPVADARLGLNDIVALADKLQLSAILPQIQQLVSSETLQQLQSQFLNTMITAVGSHWNLNTIAQQLQQLFTQFVPGVAQMRIDWEQIGQQALNGVVTALPSILIGALSLFGKRDVARGINIQQLLSTLPVDKLAQLVQAALNTHKDTLTKVLAKVRQLLQQFFPAYQGRIDFDALVNDFLSLVNNVLPALGNSLFQSLLG
jgi:predicted ATPase